MEHIKKIKEMIEARMKLIDKNDCLSWNALAGLSNEIEEYENKLPESHISLVLRTVLDKEIENINQRYWYNPVDKIYTEQLLERLSKAISCQE